MENIEFKEIPIGDIRIVPSDTEIPVHDHPSQTLRPLCADFPLNLNILKNTEEIVKIITDISDDLEESEETCVTNIPQYIQDLLAVFNPLDVTECNSDLFEGQEYSVVDNTKDLQKLLSELMMRFDADPKFYTKEDYSFLMAVLYKSLLYIYNKEVPSIGENFSRVARMRGSNLELLHPVATDETEVEDEDKDSTLASVSYVDKLVLRWEAF